jgi:hypothetical protein
MSTNATWIELDGVCACALAKTKNVTSPKDSTAVGFEFMIVEECFVCGTKIHNVNVSAGSMGKKGMTARDGGVRSNIMGEFFDAADNKEASLTDGNAFNFIVSFGDNCNGFGELRLGGPGGKKKKPKGERNHDGG